jgi:cyclopropane-fatty-acyl-phospholipid synthase
MMNPQTIRASFDTQMARRVQKQMTAKLAGIGIGVAGLADHDITIHDSRAWMAFVNGSLGAGEAYMNGWWSGRALDQTMAKLFASSLVDDPRSVATVTRTAVAKLVNLQSRARAFRVAHVHYDLGIDLFEQMLDKNLVYTCGYWANAKTLDEAQIAKLDLVCRKLGLKPGMTVLDIGFGFGSFMKYACENYGVTCVGYTVSKQQLEVAKQRCAGLPIELVLADYRDIGKTRRFDRVVSIGMLEAVGAKNYRTFMDVCHNVLVDDGLMLLHTVGANLSTEHGDPWIDRYIFPNGMLPSIAQLGAAMEGRFVMEDWHNFGPDYDRTLMAWNDRFQAAWPVLQHNYEPQFKRMWEFYLLVFAGGFRARTYQLWQLVLSRNGRTQPLCRVS